MTTVRRFRRRHGASAGEGALFFAVSDTRVTLAQKRQATQGLIGANQWHRR